MSNIQLERINIASLSLPEERDPLPLEVRRQDLVPGGLDANMPPAAEKGNRGGFVRQPCRIRLQRGAAQIDPLRVAAKRLAQPRGKVARCGFVGAVEQEQAHRIGGRIDGALDLNATGLHGAFAAVREA